jgi:hypothetical protein
VEVIAEVRAVRVHSVFSRSTEVSYRRVGTVDGQVRLQCAGRSVPDPQRQLPAGAQASHCAVIIVHPDFAVTVKNRGRPPKPWRWEIYRAGRGSPIKTSEVYFQTMTEANRAGKQALSILLSAYPAD